MIKKTCMLGVVMAISSIFFLLKPTYAVEFQFQPRLEAGVTLYAIKIDAIHKSIPTTPDTASGHNLTQQKLEFKDTMTFVGGGTTLFINRLFLDLGMQYSFDGNDRTHASWSIFSEDIGNGSSFFESADPEYQAEFDRKDLTVSMGYAVTKQLSIFVGYKWSELDLETKFDGPYSLMNIDNYVAHGRLTGQEQLKFKYEGPFVGATHGWQIKWSSTYLGLFSVNIGLARLNCKLNQDQNGNIRIESINGVEIDPIDSPYEFSNEVTGETLGLTLALGWHGATPIRDLSYSLGVSAYRYQFDLDEADYSEISESSVVCKAGVAYAF